VYPAAVLRKQFVSATSGAHAAVVGLGLLMVVVMTVGGL